MKQVDVIDQALALPLPGPGSYTGEDTVEFFCHGGRQVAAAVVRACQAAGAVAAPPGEFTRRAFLNGRLSLDQAEAVADLIQAGSEQAARGAIGQLRGGLDAQIVAVEQPLLALLVRLEGSLEFSDEDDAAVPAGEVRAVLLEALAAVESLLELAPAGRLLREGVSIVLAGAPNAGKSSLFNCLVGEDRALVDAAAGTTRDVVTATVRRGGRLYVFHDTAGLRAGGDRVEQLGIERTRGAVRQADLVLLLSAPGEADPDRPAAQNSGSNVHGSPAEPPTIRVITKGDLMGQPSRGKGAPSGAVVTSSVTGKGLDSLWEAIDQRILAWRLDEAASLGVVLNERHRQRLLECRDELRSLVDLVDTPADRARCPGVGDEVVGTLLASLLGRFGEISGRVFSEQLLDGVFRRFCVGK